MPQLVLRNGVDGFSFYTFKNAMDIETATTTYYANGKAIFTVFGLFQSYQLKTNAAVNVKVAVISS
jgi:hypothetical protein